ncbi:MAG: polysaccharide deacetylase family protein [Clostridia bacterium]|nr:polysaccharide deacetylase family protein [Clostridia bacterium]
MKLQSRISLNPQKKRASRGWMVACIAVICVMVIGLGSLSVYTALTVSEQKRITEAQAASLTELEQQLAEAQSQLEQQEQALEKAKEEASTASDTIADREQTIRDQEASIKEQQKTIDELKQQIALKQGQTNQTTAPSIQAPEGVDGLKNKKLVALTFDDGPGPYTARLLDGLKERGVRATFFVLGTRVSSYPELIKRMAAEGHEVGNHSQGHKELTKLSAASIKTEMDSCATKIKNLIGHEPTVMRCPYGSYNNAVKAYAKEKNIPIIQWDVDTRDWESKNVTAILNKTFASNGVSDGSIVLLHDIHSTTVDATFQIVDKLKAQGYTLVTVSELLHARNDKVEAGKVYFEG